MTIFPVKCLVHSTGVCVGLCVSVANNFFCMFVVNLKIGGIKYWNVLEGVEAER